MHILIIEDQLDVVDFLRKGLLSEGYLVSVAYDGKEGLAKALSGNYTLIILDIILPKLSGLEVCQHIRSKKNQTPIIMLTAKDGIADKVNGLNAGADDYMGKPFSFDELLARIRAQQRRQQPLKSKKLSAKNLTLDEDAHEVTRNRKPIVLSATEFKLLRYFLQHKNKVLTKKEIQENVWERHFDPNSNIVDVYVKFLRNKIDTGYADKLIHTVRGVGYKLCA